MTTTRRDMLISYYENNFHLIPCGSRTDVIPDYFKQRHPNEEEDVLIKRWSKTPRVKWLNISTKQPTLKEIKQWYLQFPNVIGRWSQALPLWCLMQTHKKHVTL